jgi:hypothetical protein
MAAFFWRTTLNHLLIRRRRMTHDYQRHGTTTLFAALNVLDGSVIGRCMQQRRHEEFIRFINDVERAVPAGKLIEAVVVRFARRTSTTIRGGGDPQQAMAFRAAFENGPATPELRRRCCIMDQDPHRSTEYKVVAR